MKKIYLLFAMLLGCFSSAAYAQLFKWVADEENPLIVDVEQFSSPYSDSGEGNFYSLIDKLDECPDDQHPGNDFWHSNWHNGDQPAGTHYFQVDMSYVEMPDEYSGNIVFVYTRRSNADNDHTTKWRVMGTNDPDAEKDDCKKLADIETPFTSKDETLTSDTIKYNPDKYQYLRFYSEEQYPNSRGYFHLARFQIYPAMKEELDPWEVKFEELDAAWQKYWGYVDEYGFEFDDQIGDEPGMFNEDAVLAFVNYLYDVQEAYERTDFNSDNVSVDSMQAMIDGMEPLFQAAIVRNPLSLADGYYKIRGALVYTNDGEEVQKFMYGVLDNGKYYARWNTPDEETPECYYLWKLTNKGDGTYDLVNCATESRLDSIFRSQAVTMSENDYPIAIDIACNMEGTPLVNIRLAVQEADNYFYAHQAGHNNGQGVGGDIVGWSRSSTIDGTSCGGSEWIFDAVSADDAATIIEEYEAVAKKHEIMVDDYKSKLKDAKAKLPIAVDVNTVKLITSAEQMSSPFSQNDLGGADGGNLKDGVLIDGKTDTYWHSVWSGSNVPEGRHYLQVEMPEDFDDAQDIYIQFTRRNTNNNQITSWLIRGTDDPEETEEENCEELFTFETPWHSDNQTESYASESFNTNGWKYIRFYNNGTNSGSAFFHMSELQLAYDVDNPNSQYKAMGEIATNLESIIEEQAEIDLKELTEDEYNTFVAAYNAFIEKFVDPTELRAAIKQYESKTAEVAVGTNPGFWPNSSTADALNQTIADAKAYDEAGDYLPATSEDFIATMEAQAKAYDEAPLKIQTGKWYRFRFGTEEEYDQYGWAKAGNFANYRVVDEDTVSDTPINEALFGKYFTVAKWEDVEIDLDDNSNPVNAHVIVPIDKNEVALNNYVFADDWADIVDPDMALFRFVSIGDTAYAIQNKATGLYMQRKPESGDIRMTIHPSLFSQQINGYGQNVFFIKNLDNAKVSPLHMAQSYNILTSWGNESGSGYKDADGRRGSFFVEEVADVEAGYQAPTETRFKAYPGEYSMRCYPVTVTIPAEDGEMWSVVSIADRTAADPSDDESVETATINLVKVENNTAVAGRPFIFIQGGHETEYEEPGDEDEPEVVHLSYQNDLVAQYQTDGLLKGVFAQTAPGEGAIILKADGSYTVTTNATKVSTDAAYISDGEGGPFDSEVDLAIEFTGGPDAIAATLAKVSANGEIYTVDGRLVSKNGNLNTINALPKGSYVINGVTVVKK